MGFSFLHFLGNFGDKDNQDDNKNRHGVLGFLEDTGEQAFNSAKNTAKAVTTDVPNIADALGTTVGSVLSGEHGADLQASKEKAFQDLKNTSFGSLLPDDTQDLQNESNGQIAGTLGKLAGRTGENVLNVATLGADTPFAAAGETVAKNIGNDIARKAVQEGVTGAGFGAGYSASKDLENGNKSSLDFLKDTALGTAEGALGGATIGAGTEALTPAARIAAAKAKATLSDESGHIGGTADDMPIPTTDESTITPEVTPQNVDLFHGSDAGKLKVDNNGNVNLGHNAEDVSKFGDVVKIPTDNITVQQIPSKNEMFTIAADPKLKQQYIDKGVDVLQADNHSIAINPETFSEKTGVNLRPSPRNQTIEEAMAAHQASLAPEAAPESLPEPAQGGSEPSPSFNAKPTPEPQPQAPIEPPTRSTLPEGDTGGPQVSALDKLDSKMIPGVRKADDEAVNLSDVEAPEKPKGILGRTTSSIYSKVTKGRNLDTDLSAANKNILDRYAPLDSLNEKYESLTGDVTSPENNPYVQARLASGSAGKLEERINDLDSIVKESGVDAQSIKQLGVIDQMLTDRSGIKNPLSPSELSQARAELEAKLGTEKFNAAEAAVQKVKDMQAKMLDLMGEVIGKDNVERIRAANPNYFTKFDAVDHLIDDHENVKVGSSFSKATQDVIRAKGKGFDTAMGDPFESMIRQWGKVIAFTDANRVGQAVGRMAENLDRDLGEGNKLAIKTRDAEDVQNRMDLYRENKQFKPVRDKIQATIKRNVIQAKQLATELKSLSGDLVKGQKKMIVDDAKKNGDVENGALAAAKNLTDAEVKEIMDQAVNWDENKFQRIRNKIQTRDSKLTPLLDKIQDARDQAAGITDRMRNNRETASLLADKKIPDGYEKVSYFKNGIKEEVALPRDVAEAMKNMNAKQADFITKTASLQSRALRAGATSLNIAFVPKNIIRDFQTAAVTTQHQAAKDMVQNWLKAFGDAWVGGPTTKQFIDAGGSGANFFGRGSGNIEKIASRIGESKAQKVGRTIRDPKELLSLPFRLLTKVGNAAEMAPRLAEFKAAQADGLSDQAAAYAGRNITVDFDKASNLGKIANQWVPFLNARVQGNANIFQAIKRNPARASAVIATTMVAPTVATYLWNRQNHSDTYDQIPDYVKQNNFLLIYGDNKDANGNFTQVLKIPKGEVGQIFGNPLENLLDYAFQHNPESLSQIAVDTASQASPISFSRQGHIDPGLALSSVLPPAARGTLENEANFSFFRGAPIVSDKLSALPDNEQYTASTSPVAKFIGEVTGASPLKVDNMIQSVGGGLGQQIANPSKFVTSPAGSFSGASGNEVENQFYSTLDKTSPLRASASLKINKALAAGDTDTAQQIADSYNAQLRAKFAVFAKNYGTLATKDMVDQFQKQKINLTSATIAQRVSAQKAAARKLERQQELAS